MDPNLSHFPSSASLCSLWFNSFAVRRTVELDGASRSVGTSGHAGNTRDSQIVLALLLAAGPGPGGAAKGGAAELERGEKLFKAGDLAGALQAFDNAGKADAKDPRAPYLRGVVLEKKNDGAGAEKAYREAISRDSQFGPAHNNLGAILLGRNDLPAAEKELLAATASDPKNASAAFNLGLAA